MTISTVGKLSVLCDSIRQRMLHIRGMLSSCGQSHVSVIPVTKEQPVSVLWALAHLGITVFAENYVQELERKLKILSESSAQQFFPHFIGVLSSRRKARRVVRLVNRVDSVSSLEILSCLNDYREREPLSICLQVNVSRERTKQGFAPDDLSKVLAQAQRYSLIKVIGFMALVRLGTESEEKLQFTEMRSLFDQHRQQYPDLSVLSMGTSEDFLWAAECGATEVRIGRRLLGERGDE